LEDPKKDPRKHVVNTARQLPRYLLAREKFHRGTLPSGANLEAVRSTEKMEGDVPLSAYAERFLSDESNREARQKLEIALRYLAAEEPKLYAALLDEQHHPGFGVRQEGRLKEAHKTLSEVRSDVAALRQKSSLKRRDVEDLLKLKEVEGGLRREVEAIPRWLDRYAAAATKVGEFVEIWWGGTWIEVHLDADDERERQKTQEAYNQERKATRETSLRSIGNAIERIRLDEGLGGVADSRGTEAAIGLYRDRLERDKEPDVGRRRCYEAVGFVRAEREDGAA
jgi:hypothetical protein